MNITETPPKASIPTTAWKFTCDTPDLSIAKPLPNRLNFFLLIIGKSGMGKSTLLMNLVCRRNSPYRKRFDKVWVWSPSLGTLDSNPFRCLPEEQMFEDLTIENVEEVLSQVADSGEKHLFVWDDVVNSFKTSRELETLLTRISHNRRHLAGEGGSVSVIATSQVFKSKVPPPIRKNVSHLITFRPAKMDLDAIFEEYVLVSKANWERIVRYVFRAPRDFLYLDLQAGPEAMFHRNWCRLTLGLTP
jgi:hypothetical protein